MISDSSQRLQAQSTTLWGLSLRDLFLGVQKKMKTTFMLSMFHSFVCLRESFQMVKEDQTESFIFYLS